MAAEALAVQQENGTAQVVPGGYRDAIEHVAALWKARTKANAHNLSFALTLKATRSSDARGMPSVSSAATWGRSIPTWCAWIPRARTGYASNWRGQYAVV